MTMAIITAPVIFSLVVITVCPPQYVYEALPEWAIQRPVVLKIMVGQVPIQQLALASR